MQKRSLIVLVLGIVIALGTALSLRNRASDDSSSVAKSQILVAATDIPAGGFVRADANLAMLPWPKDNITPVMITGETAKTSDFNGAVARRAISKGEPIAKNTLVRRSEGGFMSAVLEPGKRAVSIPVDATSGNAGFIFPGDHVDLILTHTFNKQSGGDAQRASETFIEDVRILAVDQSLDNPENKAILAKTVTLEVTPKQAEEINVAKDLGKISLSLRSLATKQVVDAVPADASGINHLDDVLKENIEREQARMGQPDTSNGTSITRDSDVSKVISSDGTAGTRVQVIRGNERSEVVFGTAAAEANRVPQ
jgi:pilus assembly protein CpaB